MVIEAREGVDSLSALARQKLWRAENGQHGSGANRHGRNGEGLLLAVPPGTVVMDAEKGYVIKDLARAGDGVVAARGGKGGRGNAFFKSATHQAPRECTRGEEGERRVVVLELKVIADVGLIGKPNAGKSTLLSRLSHARPQIADYPFTTKQPHLGRVQIDLDRSFIMADIPGLIEGAHQGLGLGHEFLRHVERAGILVHLVEPSPLDGSDPCDNYRAIRQELLRYNEILGARPELVVVTKAELPGAEKAAARLRPCVGRDVLSVSAVTGQGLNRLMAAIARLLDENQPP